MAVPDKVLELIDRFDYNIDDYKQGKYNETQVRQEFINPFFKTLGWDVDNEKGYAEAYKDVVHEDAIKVKGTTKAPDYSFRVGGMRKFFLEAKKPSVNIKDDVHPAYQLRRYAWSAKLPLSILTDFEELAVYDCRIKPVKTDKASKTRTFYLTYKDYANQWDDIANIFSHEAILKGSFDKYVESHKAKRGTAEVDAAFLQEIERWRDLLARNIALRNPDLTQRELNFAIQLTIDRLIFLRICEDRGIEPYGRLRDLQKGNQVYRSLLTLFRQADDRYNSGLFHFKTEKGRPETPDELTPNLSIDDKILKDILQNLYYPDSPYEFSVLPADILGQVYEQFLGKVIRLTPAHRAVVEDKPEVKKAGGVYYTPTYIVDYIVKQTMGKLVEGKKPGPRGAVSKLRILDPACGSGSFLLGAYQFLLDWHLEQYMADGPEKWAKGRNPRLYQAADGDWRLTTDERKRVLLNNIYGVDIDTQAVEVTKLSLLLKVLEGENEQTLGRQLSFLQERVLPDLGHNIKCGNSLIGPDFYDGQQLTFLDEDELYRINAFDWQTEFADIMGAGGFDAVIGNPPYVRQEGLGDGKGYYTSHYKTFRPTADLYVNFIEKGYALLKKIGLFGMIISNKWLRAAYGKPLREFLVKNVTIEQIIDLAGLPVFANATVRTIILIYSPSQKQNGTIHYLAPISLEDFRTIHSGEQLQRFVNQKAVELSILELSSDGWSLSIPGSQTIIKQMRENTTSLHKYVAGKMFRGVVTGLNKVFIIDQATHNKLIDEDPRSAEVIKPVLAGRDTRRYLIEFSNRYLIFTRRGIDINEFPAVMSYLEQYRQDLTPKKSRTEKRGRKPGKYEWYEIQDTIDYYAEFERPKIIYPDISTSCRFTFDQEGYFGSNTTYFIPTEDLYLLGLLNSRLGQFYFSEVCAGLEGGGATYLRFFGQYLKEFPVRTIDFTNSTEKAHHDQMVSLVEKMLDLHNQLAAAKIPQAKTILQRQIETTDRQIDTLVYELYELSEDEIRIVEGAV